MWVTYFIQPYYFANGLCDYIVILFLSIFMILTTYFTPKEWEKWEKTQKLKQNN